MQRCRRTPRRPVACSAGVVTMLVSLASRRLQLTVAHTVQHLAKRGRVGARRSANPAAWQHSSAVVRPITPAPVTAPVRARSLRRCCVADARRAVDRPAERSISEIASQRCAYPAPSSAQLRDSHRRSRDHEGPASTECRATTHSPSRSLCRRADRIGRCSSPAPPPLTLLACPWSL